MLAGVGSEISDWPFAEKSRTESAAGPMVTDRAKNGDPELGFGPPMRGPAPAEAIGSGGIALVG